MVTHNFRVRRNGKLPKPMQETLKQAAALRMRVSGFTYEEITERLGFDSPHKCMMHINYAVRKTLIDSTEQYRDIEILRLEGLHKLCWQRVKAGKLDQIPNLLRIMERRSKLLGLDAPEKHDILFNEVERLAAETGLDRQTILKEADAILANARNGKLASQG